jgi:hypothetical protein
MGSPQDGSVKLRPGTAIGEAAACRDERERRSGMGDGHASAGVGALDAILPRYDVTQVHEIRLAALRVARWSVPATLVSVTNRLPVPCSGATGSSSAERAALSALRRAVERRTQL